MLRAEGGFEPLDYYIPTGLKPAPSTYQAHPRTMSLKWLLITYIIIIRDIFMRM